MKSKKILTACLSVGAILSLCACGNKAIDNGLVVCLASEPENIDPALNSAVDGATLCVHLNSGLFRYVEVPVVDEKGNIKKEVKLVNDLVDSYEVEKDVTVTNKEVTGKDTEGKDVWSDVTYNNGVKYTFKLRSGLKWSNGDPITANDFVWSWNRACSKTLAADYGYMFDPICDAVYHENVEKEADGTETKIQATVVGDATTSLTFTVNMMVPITYAQELFAFPTFQPVHKATVEAHPDDWATNPDTYICSGAYKMKSWAHNSNIVLEKRADYWNADEVTCNQITFALSDNDAAMLASYESGEYSLIDSVPNDQINVLKAKYGKERTDGKPAEYFVKGQMGTYYVSFNVNKNFGGKDAAQCENIRRALGLLMDRKYIVDEIGQADQTPANAFVSSGLTDAAGGEFVSHNGLKSDGKGYFKKGETTAEYESNVAEAIQLLKDVGYTYNETTKKFTDFPTIDYLYNTGTGHQAIAQNLCDTFAKYGITLTLKSQEWNTFLNTRKQGDYTIARNGWLADYNDPSSYLSMWTTASGNNDCQFGKGDHASVSNTYIVSDGAGGTTTKTGTWAQVYDKLMDDSNKEADPVARFRMLHQLEDILMQTGAICPLYYYTDIYMIKPNVKGFFSTPLGYKFFMYCTKTF